MDQAGGYNSFGSKAGELPARPVIDTAYWALDTVLSYASPSIGVGRNRTRGAIAIGLAMSAAIWIVWRSLDLCHTLLFFGPSRLGGYWQELYWMPIGWLVPLAAIFMAYRARVGVSLCRAALWASIIGWGMCIATLAAK